jgi:hypothetical protein
MTDAQLAKAERLGKEHTFRSVLFRRAFIDATGLPDRCCDVVISNGVINLSPDTFTCGATLWASCIGGAMQRDAFVEAIERHRELTDRELSQSGFPGGRG